MRAKLSVIVLLAICVGSASPSFATDIAVSTFDVSADGWTNGDFLSAVLSPTAVNYLATGGFPGGHIQVPDNYGWNAFYAPAKFLGDLSAAYTGYLTFDIYDTAADTTPYAAVMLWDGTQYAYSQVVLPTTIQGPPFHSLSVQLLAATGWSSDVYGSTPISEATLQAILSNVQILAIQADWHTGGDDVHLDNVVLRGPGLPVPEPGTTGSLLVIAAGLLEAGRRLRRR